MISIKIETLNPSIPKDNDDYIEDIIVSFISLDEEINTACALLSDLRTV